MYPSLVVRIPQVENRWCSTISHFFFQSNLEPTLPMHLNVMILNIMSRLLLLGIITPITVRYSLKTTSHSYDLVNVVSVYLSQK